MADLEKLAKQLLTNGPHKVEQTSRRVRALFTNQYVFDVTTARHVWEHPYYPYYYVPKESVKLDLTKGRSADESKMAFHGTLRGHGRSTERVLLFEKGPLAGLVRFEFDAMGNAAINMHWRRSVRRLTTADAWFEEDTPIYQHPKDPYKRIDILPSSRNITIKLEGVTIAEGSANMFLFETMLRPRYYMPKTSLNWEYVLESDTTTRCPYKGLANYYSIEVNGNKYPDVIWYYQYPTSESALIQGMMCAYNEKVDVFVDGKLEEK